MPPGSLGSPQRGAQNASHGTGHGTECRSDSCCARSRGCTVSCVGSSRHPEEEDAGAVQVLPSGPAPGAARPGGSRAEPCLGGMGLPEGWRSSSP